MNSIERKQDLVFGNFDLENLYDFKNFPVFMGCVSTPKSEDLFFDMNWKISKKSGMIQLNPLLPLEIVYKESHGSGTTGKMWDIHHEAFSLFINKYSVKNVLEIGGFHGILAKKCIGLNNNINWTIIDPNPTITNSEKIKVIKGFFDNKFASDVLYDSVIHSHLIEHVYDINEFIQHKASFMKNGNLLFFSLPNMSAMLERKYTNCLNFEHTMYLTEPYIEYFLTKYGFDLVDKQYFKNDHSIFYCARKTDTTSIIELDSNLYDKNKKTFLDYIDYHTKDVNFINGQTKKINHPIFLFGAHIFSQYLISFGLDTKKIVSLLDNDSTKHKKRLYGTDLFCEPPSVLKQIDTATVILRAGGYNEEIKEDIIKNINPNIIFI